MAGFSTDLPPSLETRVRSYQPATWLNPAALDGSSLAAQDALSQSAQRFHGAAEAWQDLAPLVEALFAVPGGRIDSPLLPLPAAVVASSVPPSTSLASDAAATPQPPQQEQQLQRLFIKADNELPVCGSVKARGGLFEVLRYARRLAAAQGWLPADSSAAALASAGARSRLSDYTIAVGSTGNLGLSVGIGAAALGMRATVHMSREAKAWKQRLLADRGATVVLHDASYSTAVAEGRAAAAADPMMHFVDDESSTDLFEGYSTAALHLQAQLAAAGVEVTSQRPLVVHLPCGVGGAPGGLPGPDAQLTLHRFSFL